MLLCKLPLFCDEDTLDGTITSERLFDPEKVYGKK